ILGHPGVRRLLDFSQPVGLLLVGVLHFVPDDAVAYDSVAQLVAALAPGSFVVVSHAASEAFDPVFEAAKNKDDVYRQRTSTPGTSRTREEFERFFGGLDLLEPGVVRSNDWRPEPDSSPEPAGNGLWA